MENHTVNISMLSLISNKLNILVVGGGVVGISKAKHFSRLGCNVEIVTMAKENEEYLNSNIKVIYGGYQEELIEKKHLIIIAVKEDKVRRLIKEDCDKRGKIYIDCTNFKEGIGMVPVQMDTEEVSISVNTKGGNPKAAVFLGNKIKDNLTNYNEYIRYTTIIRNEVKGIPEIKRDIINFIFSQDFYFFFCKGKGNIVLRLFY